MLEWLGRKHQAWMSYTQVSWKSYTQVSWMSYTQVSWVLFELIVCMESLFYYWEHVHHEKLFVCLIKL